MMEALINKSTSLNKSLLLTHIKPNEDVLYLRVTCKITQEPSHLSCGTSMRSQSSFQDYLHLANKQGRKSMNSKCRPGLEVACITSTHMPLVTQCHLIKPRCMPKEGCELKEVH